VCVCVYIIILYIHTYIYIYIYIYIHTYIYSLGNSVDRSSALRKLEEPVLLFSTFAPMFWFAGEPQERR
jgi:hypothetical protein